MKITPSTFSTFPFAQARKMNWSLFSFMGGFVDETQKPDCPLIGEDGNIFNLMGIASRTLRDHGMGEQAKDMTSRIRASGSYDEALNIIGEYVNITSAEESDMDMDGADFGLKQ